MTTLALAGIDVPISTGSWQQDEPLLVGRSMDRRFSGRLGSGIRAVKRRWTGKTPLLPLATAAAFEGLLRGDGHRWSFDVDLFSDKGLGPEAGHAATQGTSGKFSGKVSVAGQGLVVYRAGLGSRWTLALWHWESTVWVHYLITSTSVFYRDGVGYGSALPFGVSVVAGALTLYGTAVIGIPELYDDVLAVPYIMPADWPAQLYARAAALPAIPELDAVGDVVLGSATVRGRVAGQTVQHLSAGEYAELSFSLEEV